MNHERYLCITIDGFLPNYFNENEFNSNSTHEIISKLNPDKRYLNVKTPLSSKPLNDDIITLDDFIYLKQKFKSKYILPPCYLFFTNEIIYEFSIKPICKQKVDIPQFYIKISDLSTMTISKLNQLVLETLELTVNSSYLFFVNNDLNISQIIESRLNNDIQNPKIVFNTLDQMKITQNESIEMIFQKAQTYQLYISIDLDDTSLALINRRSTILKEIISTEKTYINDLNIIQAIWKPGMHTILNSDDFTKIFDGISEIYSSHFTFLTNLEKSGFEYSSIVSYVFLELSESFDRAFQYVSSYPYRFDILSLYHNNEPFQKASVDLSKSCDDRDLKSYLIIPLKRITQYSTYLSDLLTVTPKSHPDFSLLQFTFSKIDEFTQSIKKTIEASQKQEFLLNLQKQISNFDFVNEKRQLIMHINVSIGNNYKKGEILVFSDLIVVIKKGKTSKVILHSNLDKFPYIDQFPDELSITVQSIQIHFMNEIEMRSFFIELEKLQMRAQLKYEKLNNKPFFVWNLVRLQRKLPQLSFPLVSFFDDSLIILSTNINSDKIPELYRVVLSTGNIYQTYAAFPSFDCQVVSATHNKNIYFVYKNQILKYDLRPNQVSSVNIGNFEPRIGHTLTFINDNLYIFGGKSLETNELLNDLVIFNSRHETISVIRPPETTPSPRWHHLSFLFNGKLYIFGGETSDGSFQNELYEFDINSSQWTLIELTGHITPKIGCKCAVKNNFVVILSENNEIGMINMDTKEAMICENFRNVPTHLNNFDIVSTDYQNSPLIVVTEQSLYGLNMINVLKKSASYSILPIFNDNLIDDNSSIKLSQTPKRSSKKSVFFKNTQNQPLSSSQKIDNEHLYHFGYGLKPNSPNKNSMKLRKSATSDKFKIPNNTDSDYDLSLNSEEFKMFTSKQNHLFFTPQPNRNSKYNRSHNFAGSEFENNRRTNSSNTTPDLMHTNRSPFTEKLPFISNELNNDNENIIFDAEFDREINSQFLPSNQPHNETQNAIDLNDKQNPNGLIDKNLNDLSIDQNIINLADDQNTLNQNESEMNQNQNDEHFISNLDESTFDQEIVIDDNDAALNDAQNSISLNDKNSDDLTDTVSLNQPYNETQNPIDLNDKQNPIGLNDKNLNDLSIDQNIINLADDQNTIDQNESEMNQNQNDEHFTSNLDESTFDQEIVIDDNENNDEQTREIIIIDDDIYKTNEIDNDLNQNDQNDNFTNAHENDIQNENETVQTSGYIPLILRHQPAGQHIDLETTSNLIVEVKDDTSAMPFIATATISALLTSGALYLLFRRYHK